MTRMVIALWLGAVAANALAGALWLTEPGGALGFATVSMAGLFTGVAFRSSIGGRDENLRDLCLVPALSVAIAVVRLLTLPNEPDTVLWVANAGLAVGLALVQDGLKTGPDCAHCGREHGASRQVPHEPEAAALWCPPGPPGSARRPRPASS